MFKKIIVACVFVLLLVLIWYLFKDQIVSTSEKKASQAKPVAQKPGAIKTLPTVTIKDGIYKIIQDSEGNSYFTDMNGRTLYTYDKDELGISNCNGDCAKLWPPFSTKEKELPPNMNIYKRTDGKMQLVWKDSPLYYYSKDQKQGDIKGNNIDGDWHTISP